MMIDDTKIFNQLIFIVNIPPIIMHFIRKEQKKFINKNNEINIINECKIMIYKKRIQNV